MEAVCFDMDGVLVDSEDFWIPRETEELFPELVPEDDVDVTETTGMNYREIYDYLATHYDVAMDREAFLDWFDATARDIYGEQVQLLDGAPALLSTLDERGVGTALVSSSPHHWIDLVRDRFDLRFDAVVSADGPEVAGKPEPDVYEEAARRLGVTPADTVAVEDSGHGIRAARRAGMHVVGFRHGTTDDVDRGDADYVASSPADLRAYLLSHTA